MFRSAVLLCVLLVSGCSSLPVGHADHALAGQPTATGQPDPHRLQWERRFGGVDRTADLSRLHLCRRVVGDLRVDFHLLRSSEPGAFVFADGSIYLTRGLMNLASDDELAAAVAHECGHLVLEGRLPAASLASAVADVQDVESAADAVGLRILARQGVDPTAMARLLSKVRGASRDPALRDALSHRIAQLPR